MSKPTKSDKMLIIKANVFGNGGKLRFNQVNKKTRPIIMAHIPIIVTKMVATNSGLAKIMIPSKIPIIPSRSKKYQCLLDSLTLTDPTVKAIPPIRMVMAKYMPRATSVIPGKNRATKPKIIARTPFKQME